MSGSEKRAVGLVDLAPHGSANKLHYTINGMCEFEDVSGGQSFLEFVAEVEAEGDKISLRKMRRLFWVGLIEHQPGITEREAGDIIGDVGGIAKAFEIAGEAIAASVGGDDPVEDDEDAAPQGKAKTA